jgi:hypothetical protein
MFDSKHLRSAFTLIAAAVACSTAQAALFRAYLSGTGNDANPCTLQQPCRLLPAALNAVAEGGEIWMLDSANYNTSTVTVNKSVSILAIPGAVGSIVAQNAGPAVAITAGSVALRNVVIGPVAGAASGTHGVTVTGSSTTVTIENSVIAGVPNNGVYVIGGAVKVANTVLRNNGQFAIVLDGGGSADVTTSQMLKNAGGGVYAGGSSGNTTASVSDSIISGSNSGVRVAALTGGNARISVTRSTIAHTAQSLWCEGTGTNYVFLGSNLIAYNTAAWNVAASCTDAYTAGNNQFNSNGAPTGVLTPLNLQ